jgi:hypothetical protein
MKETSAMLSAIGMHAIGLKTGAKRETALSVNAVRKGTIIGESAPGPTCVGSSSATSGRDARGRESNGTWPALCKGRESPSGSLFNASAT